MLASKRQQQKLEVERRLPLANKALARGCGLNPATVFLTYEYLINLEHPEQTWTKRTICTATDFLTLHRDIRKTLRLPKLAARKHARVADQSAVALPYC